VTASAAPRVLLACDYFIRYTSGLAEGMRANGWEPVLLDRDHDHAFGGRPGAMREYVRERLGPEQREIRIEGRVRELGRLPTVAAAHRAVRMLDAAVVHVQTCLPNDLRLVAAAGLRRGRYALTVHDVDEHPGDGEQPLPQRLLGPRLLRHAGLVFVHAEPLRQALVERGATRAPVEVVPHGVDEGTVAPLPDAPSLLFFGRLSEYKGLAVLLDAMAPLWERRPDATLTVAGEGDLPAHPALDDARVRVEHRHIEEQEVAGLYGDAAIVVLPYVEASQSGVGSLAKGFGRPLVASDVGGLRELLADGSGELVPPRDPERLAATLDDVLGDRAALERMGAAGRRTMHEQSGWPEVAAKTIAAYERHLLPGAAPGARRGRRG